MSKLCIAAAVLATMVSGEGVVVTTGDRAAGLLQVGTPNDGEDVPDWCAKDSDCQALGDTDAECQDIGGQFVCVCTNPYIGELCYEEPDNLIDGVVILGFYVITFPEADCSQFKSINGVFDTFNGIFDLFFKGPIVYYLCGSVSMVIEAEVTANNMTLTHSLMMEKVAEVAGNATFSEALQFSGSISTIKSSFHVDSGVIPPCIILNAKKTVIVEGVCRPLICNPGYVPYDEYVNGKVVASCELDTEGDDAALTDSAIAGIIFGILLLCAMVAFIIWHFARPEPESNGIPVNEPFGNNEENASDANEPYGKGEGEEGEGEGAVEASRSDIAV